MGTTNQKTYEGRRKQPGRRAAWGAVPVQQQATTGNTTGKEDEALQWDLLLAADPYRHPGSIDTSICQHSSSLLCNN